MLPTIRSRSVLLAVLVAATLAADVPANSMEMFHRGAILRAVDPGWPAWRYRREIVDVDPGGTRALVHTAPILSCSNPSGSKFDIWLVRRDGWWWIESLKGRPGGVVDC